MAAKNPSITVEQLSAATASYRRLLQRAIKNASPDDTSALQKLGTGLTALTKAASAVQKMEAENEALNNEPIDFDVMGRPIHRSSAR